MFLFVDDLSVLSWRKQLLASNVIQWNGFSAKVGAAEGAAYRSRRLAAAFADHAAENAAADTADSFARNVSVIAFYGGRLNGLGDDNFRDDFFRLWRLCKVDACPSCCRDKKDSA
jgi:hypothetical protein